MKKLYLYIRLSDADDDLKFKTESESIANQRTLLYRFVQARREFDGYEVVEFIDDGYSGTNGNRPSFERMIESLKNGEANVVICKDFSRFFRDYRSIELSVLAIVSIVAEVLFIIIKTIRNMAGDEDKTQMWKQMGHSVFNNLMYLCIVVDVFWM